VLKVSLNPNQPMLQADAICHGLVVWLWSVWM